MLLAALQGTTRPSYPQSPPLDRRQPHPPPPRLPNLHVPLRLTAPPPQDQFEWTDADLASTLEKAQLAAGHDLRPSSTKTKVALVRLLMKGCDKRAIATELGLQENTINHTRRAIRRHLITYCQQLGIEPPDATVHTTGWEPGAWRKPIRNRRSPRPKSAP